MIHTGRFPLFLLNRIPNEIFKKTATEWDLRWELRLSSVFYLANSKESWQEREVLMLHIAASEAKIFRSTISSQGMQVLFVSPLLRMGRVEGSVLVTLGVH